MPSDSKLGLVASRAGVLRGHALAVWLCLLDQASQSEAERGSVAEIDADQVAYMLEFDRSEIDTIIEAFRDKGMIDAAGHLTAWEKRNPVREDASAARTREYRKRQKEAGNVTGSDGVVTQSDAAVTRGDTTRRLEESRGDKKRKETSSSSTPPPTTTALANALNARNATGPPICQSDQDVALLLERVLEIEPTARPEEIADMVTRKAAAVAGSVAAGAALTAYIIGSVPTMFSGEEFAKYRREVAAA